MFQYVKLRELSLNSRIIPNIFYCICYFYQERDRFTLGRPPEKVTY